MNYSAMIREATEYLAGKISTAPQVGLVLGSGLGGYADTLEDAVRIPYDQIPHFPRPTAPGHSGALVFGRKNGKHVVAMQGRVHCYEGFSPREVTLPVRVMAALGVKTLMLTNACGGVNLSFQPGDLMLISDHINFCGANPLTGENLDEFGPRFPDVSDLYTASLRKAVKEKAAEAGIGLQEGVYLMYSGPNYETPAEIRAFRILGADVVGMSTVPEALAAGHSGMRVLGISCVTNMAAGVLPQKLSHQEVIDTAARVRETFAGLLDLAINAA